MYRQRQLSRILHLCLPENVNRLKNISFNPLLLSSSSSSSSSITPTKSSDVCDIESNSSCQIDSRISKNVLNAPAPLLSSFDAALIPKGSALHSTSITSEEHISANAHTIEKEEEEEEDDNMNGVHSNANHSNNNTGSNITINNNNNNNSYHQEFTPTEVRTMLLSFLPPLNERSDGIDVNKVLNLLPLPLQRQLNNYSGGIIKYVQDYYPDDVIVQDNCRLYRHVNITPDYITLHKLTAKANTEIYNGNQKRTKVNYKVLTQPPPPPLPGSLSHSLERESDLSHSRETEQNTSSANVNKNTLNEIINDEKLSEYTKTFTLGNRTNLRGHKFIIDTLVESIPTFYVNVDTVIALLPDWIKELYAETNFTFFVRRFKYYFDVRVQCGTSEVRLRPDFDHPKRGQADIKHAANLNIGDAIKHLGNLRRPAANTEASLISIIAPRMPREFTPLPEVLQDISDIVARHPAFDPRLGVTGLLEKYPEYFQIVDGKLRARSYKSAPNSIADLDRETSPLPEVFAKLINVVEAAAEDKNYSHERDKLMAMVPTGKLYALLSPTERVSVKTQCRSFPRFLRMHGKEIVVTVDNMRVYKFAPEHEVCADTLLDQRLRMNSISPDDPLLKIPAEMDDSTNADWAVKALYDALPLMQCVELSEVLSLVPSSVREALPNNLNEVRSLLDTYPDYFATWPYVDDPEIIVVQRAKVETPLFQPAEIIRLVLPLIPQGGTDIRLLFRRVPLPLQRYLYKYGMKTILQSLPEYFAISGDRVIRIK